MDLLTLDKVSVSRGERRLFSDFDIQLQSGAHHVVVGPSGAGKSTLLGLICGILKPERGRIIFSGQDIAKLSAPARDRLRALHMGVVFQNLGLASSLTIDGNLALALRMAGENHDPAHKEMLLHRLGLADRRHSKPRQLSRGEAQRAAIARALIAKPKLLVADEPTASLDTVWRDRVMNLIFEQAQAQDMTLLVSTHDKAITARFANQVVLPQGRET